MLKAVIEKDEAKIHKQITALKWELAQDIPKKDKEIFTQTIKELEAALAEMEGNKDYYDVYQEKIQEIPEVGRAEENARNVYNEVRKYDRDLADRVDTAMGILARAYEAQGFNGGLMAARGAL